jgi:hypothetical protein
MANSDASERVSVAKTSALLIKPSPSIEIIPRTYSEEDQEKIKALREVREPFPSLIRDIKPHFR